jgi:PAS domain S-box-containing protein
VTPSDPSTDVLALQRADLYAAAFLDNPWPMAVSRLADGVWIDVNRAAARALGHAREALIGKRATDFDLWVRPEEREQIVADALRDDAVRTHEVSLRRHDGRALTALISARVLQLRGEPHVLLVAQDVSDRKRVEAEVAILKHSIDVHPDAAYWFDEQNRFIYCNDAACRVLGYDLQELLGRDISVVSPRATPERMEQVWELLRRLGRFEGPAVHRRKDGTEFPVEIHTVYVRFEGREYAYGFAQDRTKQAEAKAARETLEAQLQQARKLESIGRLAGGVAHDFNNQLTVIIGHADLLLAGLDASSPLRDSAAEIRRAGMSSAGLAKQLLTFASRQQIEPLALDLNDRIEESLKMLRRLIGERIRLEWRPARDLWQVLLDPVQADQIVTNLCLNARDAIAHQGQVELSTANVAVDTQLCSRCAHAVPGEYVRLSVRDDGAGMPPDVVSRIFEPFFTTKPFGVGTGLGLSTVYGAVRQSEGFIDVASEPGRGTTFDVYVPRFSSDAVRLEPVPAGTPVPRGRESVLLVDDDAGVRHIVARTLEDLGYRVRTVARPSEAIAFSAGYDGIIDLLVTDVVMPELTGYELARTLASQRPGLRTLYLTGGAGSDPPESVLESSAVLRKPFTLLDLARQLRRVLEDR